MSKAAKEGGLKVKGCKLQVEKAGADAGNKLSTFNLQPSTLPTWLLAVLLALATIALYWPAMRCDFINFDDPECVTENIYVQNGLTMGSIQWAFSHPGQLQLASRDDVVPHAGLPAFRVETVGTSSDQPVAPCAQHRPGLSAASQHDRRDLAEPAGGGAVRISPAARGIGRVDFGTKRRVEHILWTALFDGLCAICAGPGARGAGAGAFLSPTGLRCFSSSSV